MVAGPPWPPPATVLPSGETVSQYIGTLVGRRGDCPFGVSTMSLANRTMPAIRPRPATPSTIRARRGLISAKVACTKAWTCGDMAVPADAAVSPDTTWTVAAVSAAGGAAAADSAASRALKALLEH